MTDEEEKIKKAIKKEADKVKPKPALGKIKQGIKAKTDKTPGKRGEKK